MLIRYIFNTLNKNPVQVYLNNAVKVVQIVAIK